MDELPRRQRRILFGRIIAGVALYCGFAVLGVSAAITGTMDDNAILLSVLLVGAVFSLPRRIESPEESDDKQLREHLDDIQRWLLWTRVGFFLFAVFIFLGLPRLV